MKFFVVLLVALVQANAHFNHEEAKERFTQRFGELNADKVKDLIAQRREQLANINVDELKANILNRLPEALKNPIESIDQEEIKANLEEVFSRLRPERRRRDAESEKPTEEARHPRFSQKGRFNPKDFIAQRREELSKVNIEELRDNILSRLPEKLKTRVENLDKDEIKANLEEVFQRLRSERHRRDVSAEEEVETVEVEKKEKPQRPQGRPERRERPEGPKGPKPQVEKKEKPQVEKKEKPQGRPERRDRPEGPQGRPERRERPERPQGRPEFANMFNRIPEQLKAQLENLDKDEIKANLEEVFERLRPERRRRDVSAVEDVETVEVKVEKKEKPQVEKKEKPQVEKKEKPQFEKKEKPQGRPERRERPQGRPERREHPQGRPERRERTEETQGRPERRERPQGHPEFANIFNRIPEQLKAQLENIDKDELKANLHEVFGFLRPESRHRRDATEEQVEEVETVAVQVEKKEKPQGRPERRERPEGAKGPKAHHERREGPHAERHPEAAKAHAQRRPEGPQGRPERREGPHARPEGFKAHPERREGPHAHPEGFRPRPQGFGPRPQGFGPRPQGFGPRPQGFGPRPQVEEIVQPQVPQ